MDGTLWDAVDTYTWCWNEAFRQKGIDKTMTSEELGQYMGMELTEIMNRTNPGLDFESQKQLFESVYEIEDKNLPLMGGKIYLGVLEGIARLSTRYKILLLSNCGKNGLNCFMRYSGLTPYITDNISFGDNFKSKGINMTLLKERNHLANPVYIGDTDGDRKETEKAGFPFIFVRYGFGKTDHFTLAFDDFKSLTNYFMNLK